MPLFKEYQSENIDWKLWEMTESVEELLALNLQRAANVETIRLEKRKKELLCTYLLLDLFFDEAYQLEHHATGEPYIVGSEYNISISHSASFLVVARSKQRLGVDVESLRPQLTKVMHKFCSSEEQKMLDKEQPILNLALIWSAKESVYKLTADEALIFNEQMEVLPFKIHAESGVFGILLHSGKWGSLTIDLNYLIFEETVFTFCCYAEN